MRLLYDLMCTQPVGGSKYHGGGEYAKTLFEYLVSRLGDGCSVEVCFNNHLFIDDWLLELILERDIVVHDVGADSDIYGILGHEGFDRFYSGVPYWMQKNSVLDDVECWGTIHGLRSVELPTDNYEPYFRSDIKGKAKNLITNSLKDYIRQRNVKSYSRCVEALDRIITDSNHSKYALRKWLGLDDEVRVAYCPPKHAPKPSGFSIMASESRSHFILMVSCNRWEKNAIRGIVALDALFERGLLPNYCVACCGMDKSIVKRFTRNKERFVCLGYLEPQDLEALYRDCDVFFYPTLNEGFGYPPLEAMRYGTTCVVSGVCSIPEVCGQAVLYVNPYDIGEMSTRLLQAAYEKMDETVVFERYEEVRKRQERDAALVVNALLR